MNKPVAYIDEWGKKSHSLKRESQNGTRNLVPPLNHFLVNLSMRREVEPSFLALVIPDANTNSCDLACRENFAVSDVSQPCTLLSSHGRRKRIMYQSLLKNKHSISKNLDSALSMTKKKKNLKVQNLSFCLYRKNFQFSKERNIMPPLKCFVLLHLSKRQVS